jgi:hypothetical protein
MEKISNFCVLGTLTLSLCLGGAANAAEPPEECEGGRKERFFKFGYLKGVSLVDQAWAGSGDDPCRSEELEDFVDEVIASFGAGAPPSNSPETALCYYAGSYAGVGDRAFSVLDECCMECCLMGNMIGEMAAIFYCELSLQLGGLGLDEWLIELDVALCGDAFTECCEAMFDEISAAFPSAEDPQCLPYTPSNPDDDCPPYTPAAIDMKRGGEYDEVYCQARHNQCVYEPAWP